MSIVSAELIIEYIRSNFQVEDQFTVGETSIVIDKMGSIHKMLQDVAEEENFIYRDKDIEVFVNDKSFGFNVLTHIGDEVFNDRREDQETLQSLIYQLDNKTFVIYRLKGDRHMTYVDEYYHGFAIMTKSIMIALSDNSFQLRVGTKSYSYVIDKMSLQELEKIVVMQFLPEIQYRCDNDHFSSITQLMFTWLSNHRDIIRGKRTGYEVKDELQSLIEKIPESRDLYEGYVTKKVTSQFAGYVMINPTKTNDTVERATQDVVKISGNVPTKHTGDKIEDGDSTEEELDVDALIQKRLTINDESSNSEQDEGTEVDDDESDNEEEFEELTRVIREEDDVMSLFFMEISVMPKTIIQGDNYIPTRQDVFPEYNSFLEEEMKSLPRRTLNPCKFRHDERALNLSYSIEDSQSINNNGEKTKSSVYAYWLCLHIVDLCDLIQRGVGEQRLYIEYPKQRTSVDMIRFNEGQIRSIFMGPNIFMIKNVDGSTIMMILNKKDENAIVSVELD